MISETPCPRAAAAKSLQSCWTDSVRPHRRQPSRLPHPWDSPGKNTGVGCHFLLQCIKVKSKSEVAQSCPTLSNPWTAAFQAPLSMGFSRQDYWSGVPLPSPVQRLSRLKGLQLITLGLGHSQISKTLRINPKMQAGISTLLLSKLLLLWKGMVRSGGVGRSERGLTG